MSHQFLLAAGRSFAEDGVTDRALLEVYGAPIIWDLAVTTTCDVYEVSFGKQDSAVGSRIAKNAEFIDKMVRMIATKATIALAKKDEL